MISSGTEDSEPPEAGSGDREQQTGGSRTDASSDDDPTLEGTRTAAAVAPTERRGDQIGPYKLLQLIGEGGFGRVWEAEQREPVRRRVALKIVKLGLETERVVARFEAERQALALMDHPGIAKVFDAGSTSSGRSYFVMELVAGEPITSYCDRRRLDQEQRLELFVDVCRAVHHAHQKGIIHRDIKPSNVLVTETDDHPQPKVIDFGIAKAVSASLTDRTLYTEQHQLIGTPEYMSPEQAASSGVDIDTRCDVYSLGVLLYELLIGVTPFDFRRDRVPIGEIERILREEDPPSPSGRVTTLGNDSEEIARARRLDIDAMRRSLRGELDWIVMKALDKDRTRRYDGAHDLGADVLRHLSHEPVLAGPPDLGYKVRKWIRRNRVTFAAATAVVAALLLGIVGTTWGFVRAADEAREARRQEAVAQAVNQFLNEDLLQAVAPSGDAGRGRDVSMRQVLDAASERIGDASAPGGRFADSPEIEMWIRVSLADTYVRLGEFDLAEPHAVGAVDAARRGYGERSKEAAWTLSHLGTLRRSQGQFEQASEALTQAVEIASATLGPAHENTLTYKGSLGVLLRWQGRYREAEELYRRNLEVLRSTVGDEAGETIVVQGNLANVLQETGRYDEALAMREPLLERSRRTFGEKNPTTLSILNNLGNDVALSGDYERARALFEEVLALKIEVYGEDHPSTLNTRAGLGELARVQGRYEDAAAHFRQTLTARRKILGDQHVRTVDTIERLSLALLHAGKTQESLALVEEAVGTCTQALDGSHPVCVQSKSTLAGVLLELGRPDRALELTDQTLALIDAQRATGEDIGAYEEPLKWLRFRHAWALADVALANRDENSWSEAEELLVSSAEDLPLEEVPTRSAFRQLATLLERRAQLSPGQGDRAAAEQWLRRAEGTL